MSAEKKRDWSKVRRSPHARRTVWLTPEQDAYIVRQAAAAGVSISEYIRAAALAVPPMKQRPQPQIDRKLCAAVLAELGKVGSNLNQIARVGNQQKTLTLDTYRAIRDARQEIGRLAVAVMRALGREP